MSETTENGIPVKKFYGPPDHSAPYEEALGDPGQYPFTRGTRAAGSGDTAWLHRELSGEGDARRSNAQLKRLLDMGAHALDIIGDAATYAYRDPDHPLAVHSVGTQGVSLCRLQDFIDLYDGVPLDELTLSHSVPPILTVPALYGAAVALGVDPSTVRGSVINHPYFSEDNCYAVHMPFELRERLWVNAIIFAAQRMPRFHSFLEDTYYISDGILGPVEEMALGFIEIRGIVRRVLERGLPIDAFAPRIGILVNAGMDFFEVVAKVRATRRIFARMMREEFGAKDPRSLAVNVTAHTSGFSLTAQEPLNNVIRGTVQTLALAFSGVRALEVSTFDEAFRTPSEAAHRVALRTQQISQLEAGASRVVDPLGGSWYVEALTDDLEERISNRVRDIESLGTPRELAESGFFRSIFVDGMTEHGRRLGDGSLPKVG